MRIERPILLEENKGLIGIKESERESFYEKKGYSRYRLVDGL